ncbi:MAG: FAD-dependent oxidoreductase [Victivallales bacterium]|nr:FAD-dependent oxidoreductase [Victivallales bacterium]
MKISEIVIEMPPNFDAAALKEKLAEKTGTAEFAFRIEKQSLDARKKNNIHWRLKVTLAKDEKALKESGRQPEFEIPRIQKGAKVVVVGAGPAGFFAAFTLLKAGFDTTLIERGCDVESRAEGIIEFEKTGKFDPKRNYAFGEGGAGTFSDGKLTSRSKRDTAEKRFVFSSYVAAGAPDEISYMAHPHLGTDNLRFLVSNLRKEYENNGGKTLFETKFTGLKVENGRVSDVITDKGPLQADYCVVAPGLSAYDTYQTLMDAGVGFQAKEFAVGHRVEHPQRLINKAQWNAEEIPGLKAAEYRLTSKPVDSFPVYTFCMCPGGKIVPSAAFADSQNVNGMSCFARGGEFANAGCVAAIHPSALCPDIPDPTAVEALDALRRIENDFAEFGGGFTVPFCTVHDYIRRRMPSEMPKTSYPMGLTPAALWNMLPRPVSVSIRKGLQEFNRKIRGFKTGVIMGLESKTSAPVRVSRNRESLLADGFNNLFVVGEGSGWAGGIVSSAVDGVKAANTISSLSE